MTARYQSHSNHYSIPLGPIQLPFNHHQIPPKSPLIPMKAPLNSCKSQFFDASPAGVFLQGRPWAALLQAFLALKSFQRGEIWGKFAARWPSIGVWWMTWGLDGEKWWFFIDGDGEWWWICFFFLSEFYVFFPPSGDSMELLIGLEVIYWDWKVGKNHGIPTWPIQHGWKKNRWTFDGKIPAMLDYRLVGYERMWTRCHHI